MTTYHRPPQTDSSGPVSRETALWAALASFFASLLAIGIFDVFDAEQWEQYLGAILVAAITGGAVYSKERLIVAKRDAAKRDE
jgi:hypothetical protein